MGEKARVTVDKKKGIEYVHDVEDIHFEFVTLTISDLLRCKCVGNLQEIKEVWRKLKEHKDLQVYRVRNRLKSTTKDFLVNARIKGTDLLCEIQLAIMDKKGEEDQDYLDHFNHFLYELSRETYGTIAGAAVINSHLTELVSYFGKELNKNPKVQRSLNPSLVVCRPNTLGVDGHNTCGNSLSFICSNCLEFQAANIRHLPNFESSVSIPG
jgi:hypothetical protein